MPDLFVGVGAGALRRLADAFRTGRIAGDFSAFSLAKAADPPQSLIDAVLRLKAEGSAQARLFEFRNGTHNPPIA